MRLSFSIFKMPRLPHGRVAGVTAALALVFITAVTAASKAKDETIYHFDLSYLYQLDRNDPEQAREAWDTAHLVASLQGILNRTHPRLFLRFIADVDDFWFNHLRSEGEWLEGRPVTEIESLEELLRRFHPYVRGLVLYNEELWAASNIASTIAGVEDRLALRHDPSPGSLYNQVMAMDLQWEDIRQLFGEEGPAWGDGETGSAKADAYLWAKERYLDTGKTSTEFLAYYLDSFWLTRPAVSSLENFTLSNHDFFIANRAFFFDLGVWPDETPVDDPEQPLGADRRALEAIFDSMADRAGDGIIHVGGFTPWLWKYTSHAPGGSRHGGVATEWEMNRLASEYNAVIDSDAIGYSGMANASFYQHHPMDERYPQPERPTDESLYKAGLLNEEGHVEPYAYVMFYQGDYDSAAWLNRFVPRWWQDPARGDVPLNWPFNPNLDRRAPHALHYARTRQAENEWFISGDSGPGYLNPGMLFAHRRASGRPDGWDAWIAYSKEYYNKFDLTITGFIIDGASPGMGDEGMDAYMAFSPNGIIGQKMPPQGVHRDTMPFIRMGEDFHQISSEEAARRVTARVSDIRGPNFFPYRTILRSPSWHRDVMERVEESAGGEQVRFVDAYTFMTLLRIFEQTKHRLPVPAGPYTGMKEVRFSAPGDSEGLWPVPVTDGPFETVDALPAASALRQEASERIRYLYFRVGDGFGRSTEWGAGTDLVLTASVLDTEGGRIGLHYNTAANSYETAEREIELTGTGSWREVSFVMPGAWLAHGQNGQASFRLVNFGAELVVTDIQVREKPGAR